MFEYCVGREGLDDYVLYRANPLYEEAYINGHWVDMDLGGVYSGDITTWRITAEAAMLIEQGILTPKEAHVGERYQINEC